MITVVLAASDSYVECTGLHDVAVVPTVLIVGADVDIRLHRGGVNVLGQAWPLTLSDVAGSDGDYRAALSDSIDLRIGEKISAHCTVDDGPGKHREWNYDDVDVVASIED